MRRGYFSPPRRSYGGEHFGPGARDFQYPMYSGYLRYVDGGMLFEDPTTNPSRQLPAGNSQLMGSRMHESVPGRGEGYAELNNRTPSRSGFRGNENQQKYSAVYFGTALKKLFKRLEAAEQFYGEFQRDFKEETAAVKKYATADVITELWILKVKGGGNGQDTEDGAEAYGNEDGSPEDVAERFQGEYKKFAESLKGVLAANITNELQSRVKPINRAAKIERLKEKLSLADEIYSSYS